jgi:RNA polymerase sigma factor for flagellar operon FliA
MHMTTAEGLWHRYGVDGDAAARDTLIEQHLGLVRHAARELLQRVGDSVPFDDLVGAGSIGLIQALEGFDPSRGFAFTTYALQRIRGAMLDELRAADWRPRSVRTRGRMLQAAERTLESKHGRPAGHAEIAEAVGVDLETYWEWRGDMQCGTFVAFDGAGDGSEAHAPALANTLADPDARSADESIESDERKDQLREAITTLSPRYRLVLTLSYYEELTHRQIAEILHVTESRVSQIRTAALHKLRRIMEQAELQ